MDLDPMVSIRTMKNDPGSTRHLDWHILFAFTAVAITLLSGLAAALVYSRFEPVLRSNKPPA